MTAMRQQNRAVAFSDLEMSSAELIDGHT